MTQYLYLYAFVTHRHLKAKLSREKYEQHEIEFTTHLLW